MSVEETFFRIFRRQPPTDHRPMLTDTLLPTQTKRIAIINQKGGCGKTTTAINLSACLAELGCRVLLIDMDPQAHATLGLGLRGDEMPLTVYHVLAPARPSLARVMQPTYHPNLKVIPSNTQLAASQVELVTVPGREHLLKDALEEEARDFHFVILDCPPSLNLLSVNALTAATDVLVPVQTHYLSLDGMRELFKTIDLVRAHLNPRLRILGILPTLFDSRTRMNRAMLETIKEYFPGKVFDTLILLASPPTKRLPKGAIPRNAMV